MGFIRFYQIALGASFLFLLACASVEKAPEPPPTQGHNYEPSAFRFLIGDGKLYIEGSHNHQHVRGTAATNSGGGGDKTPTFVASQATLSGKAWAEEAGPYTVAQHIQAKCDVAISRENSGKSPASEDTSYQVKVLVRDGFEGTPFELLINGENEGEIHLGTYPVRGLQGVENLPLDHSAVSHWSYSPKTGIYKIVKKMGEKTFLSKELVFDPLLKSVRGVQYEILKEESVSEVEKAGMITLARLTCQS